jgi:hypothetical protein
MKLRALRVLRVILCLFYDIFWVLSVTLKITGVILWVTSDIFRIFELFFELMYIS